MTEERQKTNISEYFSIPISQLIPGKPIPFSLHIYFEQNNHLVLFRRAGESPDAAFIERYRSKGVIRLWLLRKDEPLYVDYLRREFTLQPLLAALRLGDTGLKTRLATEYSDRVIYLMQLSIRQGVPIEVESLSETFLRDWSIELGSSNAQRIRQLWNQSAPLKLKHRHSVLAVRLSCLGALATRSLDPDSVPDFVLALLAHDLGRASLSKEHQHSRAIGATLEILSQLDPQFPPFARTVLQSMHDPLHAATPPAAQAARVGHLLSERIASKPGHRARSLEEAFQQLEPMQDDPATALATPETFVRIRAALLRTESAH